MVHCRLAAALAAGLLLAAPASAAPGGSSPSEYEVKAALTYNFLKFVEWPAPLAAEAEVRVCVLGSQTFAAEMKRLQGRRTGGRTLAVVVLGSLAEAAGCHALFLGTAGPAPETLAGALAGSGVLTLSDTKGFGARGVAINFFIEDDRVRFEANLSALRRAGVQVSSKVLRLARLVAPK